MVAGAVGAEDLDLVGVLEVVWGDPYRGEGEMPAPAIELTSDDGVVHRLDIDMAVFEGLGGPRLAGQRVRVAGSLEGDGPVVVQRLDRAPGPKATSSLIGSQPWISIMCKYAGNSAEPKNLTYFRDMFQNTPGRLDHYWREVSYNNIDIVGSTAVGWVTLPHPQSYYIVDAPGCSSSQVDFDGLFDDCTAAVDSIVDFSNAGGVPFAGINLMFNGDLDGCAWGGGNSATLDGVSKYWRATWEPPWGYTNVCVMAHEMGHGFGLPHSNNWDGDSDNYDNTWDVMSDSWHYAGSDPTYGTIGKHTIAYHKYDLLGWIPPAKVYQPAIDSLAEITIDDLALASTPNWRMAQIPIPGGNTFYTVEARGRTGLYDGHLPSEAIIIHEVDPGRSQDAWAYDAAAPPANNAAGEGTMWRVGETFSDPIAHVVISVESQTANGFVVRIAYGAPDVVFADGFESTGTVNWSQTVP
jgi:M6 family metalloprotease-like protein